jgi:hypothetical protein
VNVTEPCSMRVRFGSIEERLEWEVKNHRSGVHEAVRCGKQHECVLDVFRT